MGAVRCEIFTDVDGVYTADPRLVPEARRLDEIGFEEMLELAHLGAKVLQTRSVEHAWVYGLENNEWITKWVDPVRERLTSKLPPKVLRALSLLPSSVLWALINTKEFIISQ